MLFFGYSSTHATTKRIHNPQIYFLLITILFADDTLWINETFFRDAEDQFCALLKEYISYDECQKRLFEMEMRNLPMYGYGIKPFTLSLIEAAIEITDNKVSISQISELIKLGKTMLEAQPQEFLMVGNSLKSDILPVLEIGGHAFHIPFHTTWIHEQVEEIVQHANFKELSNAAEIVNLVSK